MNTFFNSAKSILLLLAFSLTLLGCTNETVLDLQEETLTARNGTQFHFNTSLKGKNLVPANNSKAAGQAIVTINKDETKIHYKLITANIDNVLFAHFHNAPAGVNGNPVATLYFNPNDQPSGPANGVLAEGYITAGNLINDFDGLGLDVLIDAIRNGNIYINVHSLDFPPGEIRGQL